MDQGTDAAMAADAAGLIAMLPQPFTLLTARGKASITPHTLLELVGEMACKAASTLEALKPWMQAL
jgi:hypothetical protein